MEPTLDAAGLERAGQWTLATEEYRRSFEQMISERRLPNAIRALHGAARMCQQQGLHEEAEELADLCREVAERNGLPQSAARAINTLALLRYAHRDWDGACALFRNARDRALDAGDDGLVGMTCLNLGVVANVEGDLQQARTRYLGCIAATVRGEDKTTAMKSYNNLGMVCADLRDWLEAEVCFDRGIEIAEQIGDSALLAKLHANRAEPLIETGEISRAWDSLDLAERIASWTEDREIFPVLARFRGKVSRLKRNFHAADQHLAHALRLATEADLPLDRAEVLEEIARLRREQDRPEEACAAAKEALDGFHALGAERDVARVETLLREWGG